MGIEKVKAIGFDWDGTILDSMSVKARCFAESILKFYPSIENRLEEIKKTYLKTRGTLRTQQLSIVQDEYSLDELPEDDLKKWSSVFTSMYSKRKMQLFEDSIRTLDELKGRGYRLFLSSSVPQDDLDKTLGEYSEVKKYFKFILGTREGGEFKKGPQHLNYVSKRFDVPLERIAFVGDGKDDVSGANKAGCFSVAKADPRVPGSKDIFKGASPDLIIEKLRELLEYFPGPESE